MRKGLALALALVLGCGSAQAPPRVVESTTLAPARDAGTDAGAGAGSDAGAPAVTDGGACEPAMLDLAIRHHQSAAHAYRESVMHGGPAIPSGPTEYRVAADALAAWLVACPDAAEAYEARYLLGDALYHEQRYEEAAVELTRVRDDPGHDERRNDAAMRVVDSYERLVFAAALPGPLGIGHDPAAGEPPPSAPLEVPAPLQRSYDARARYLALVDDEHDRDHLREEYLWANASIDYRHGRSDAALPAFTALWTSLCALPTSRHATAAFRGSMQIASISGGPEAMARLDADYAARGCVFSRTRAPLDPRSSRRDLRVGATSEDMDGDASVGADHFCTLARGHVLCEGWLGRDACLPAGARIRMRLPGLASVIASGGGRACAITRTRRLYCWGHSPDAPPDERAECPTDELRPAEIEGLRFHAREVSLGGDHACVLLDDGHVTCWTQWVETSTLPLGPPIDRGDVFFVQLETGGALSQVQQLAVTATGACALDAQGAVWCWGSLAEGCGADLASCTAARAHPLTFAATQLRCGTDGCCAFDASRALACWGAAESDVRALVEDTPAWIDLAIGAGGACVADDRRVTCRGVLRPGVEPSTVGIRLAEGIHVTAIDADEAAVCVTTSDRSRCWTGGEPWNTPPTELMDATPR